MKMRKRVHPITLIAAKLGVRFALFKIKRQREKRNLNIAWPIKEQKH